MTKLNSPQRILIVAVCLSAGIWGWTALTTRKAPLKCRTRVFEGFCGWGYDILVNDSLLIRQESVPVLEGNCGFARKQWAEAAAAIIINKIENGRHPRLTSFDLREIADINQLQHVP